MKNIKVQADNKINLVGKLMDVTFGNGKVADGRNYERATATIQVTQTYGGHTETSDIPVSFFAYEFTKEGAPNPMMRNLHELKKMNTAQNVGIDAAARVRLNGCTLQENNFVARSGQLVNGWQLRGSFVNEAKISDAATFSTEIYIMGITPEMNSEGDTTGRLLIKGGIVQYGGRLDVVEFVAEGPDQVEYISSNWEENQTVVVKGRIRVTSQEEEVQSSGWGEDVPDVTTRFIRELVVTTGDEKEEDFSYDPTEIKKAFIERKGRIEQLQEENRRYAPKQGAGTANAAEPSKYSWQ